MTRFLFGLVIGWLSVEKLNAAFGHLCDAVKRDAILITVPSSEDAEACVTLRFDCPNCGRTERLSFSAPPETKPTVFMCPGCRAPMPVRPDLQEHITKALQEPRKQ